jgi:hypothetical protein
MENTETVFKDPDEYVREWERYVSKWKRRTLALGILVILSVLSSILFFPGQPLRRYWQQGRDLLFVSGTLFSLFIGSAGATCEFWAYLRYLRKEVYRKGSQPE